MKPLIKWPGGKTREITQIHSLIPPFDRYIEPFFGGGALFFHLKPKQAAINDVSPGLMEFYTLVKEQDPAFHKFLVAYEQSFSALLRLCEERQAALQQIFQTYIKKEKNEALLQRDLEQFADEILTAGGLAPVFDGLCLSPAGFRRALTAAGLDKIRRTAVNHQRRPFQPDDLIKNLVTGFASGYYLYFRGVYNDINLKRVKAPSAAYRAANFYFVREYCYGSMFRYNGKGEFNIPYGGISYNHKNLGAKIDAMFCDEAKAAFQNTSLSHGDFEPFLGGLSLTKGDFVFLDPPYDTDFSDYEGNAFSKADQERLAAVLKDLPARFLMVIKNTDFIHSLYEKDFDIRSFENTYTYNMRSRNQRSAEHLIITNYPVSYESNG